MYLQAGLAREENMSGDTVFLVIQCSNASWTAGPLDCVRMDVMNAHLMDSSSTMKYTEHTLDHVLH